MTTMGKEFRGSYSIAETGKKCKSWDDLLRNAKDILNSHFGFIRHMPYHEREQMSWDDEKAMQKRIENQDANYCRNPTWAERPWCIVSQNFPLAMEYCDVPFCLRPKGLFGFHHFYLILFNTKGLKPLKGTISAEC